MTVMGKIQKFLMRDAVDLRLGLKAAKRREGTTIGISTVIPISGRTSAQPAGGPSSTGGEEHRPLRRRSHAFLETN